MKGKTDIAILNTNDDEALSDYFTKKQVGEECTITITGKFLGLEEGDAQISIQEVEMDYMPDEESSAEGEEYEESEPSGAEIVLGGK